MPCVSASAVDAERKPYHFHLVGDDALPDVANGIKNVLKTKLKLNSPLSESDRRGSQLQFCWTHICHDSLRAGARAGRKAGRWAPHAPRGVGGHTTKLPAAPPRSVSPLMGIEAIPCETIA